jgi:hypothetical protein
MFTDLTEVSKLLIIPETSLGKLIEEGLIWKIIVYGVR